MLPSLLKNELAKQNLSYREAARQIGVSHTTLISAAEGRPVDVEPLRKICQWLNIPLSAAVDDQVDPALILTYKLLKEMPELARIFEEAAQAVKMGQLSPDDFNTIADYAAYILSKKAHL